MNALVSDQPVTASSSIWLNVDFTGVVSTEPVTANPTLNLNRSPLGFRVGKDGFFNFDRQLCGLWWFTL